MKRLFLAATLVCGQAISVSADNLPGVQPAKPIVQPRPEPPDTPPAQDGWVKMGDWDVKVSGAVTVDIGVGKIKPPRR